MVRPVAGETEIRVRGYRLLWCCDHETRKCFYLNLDNDTPITQEDFDFCFSTLTPLYSSDTIPSPIKEQQRSTTI